MGKILIPRGAVTFVGPLCDDPNLLAQLPRELADVLATFNGFILHGGGLHVRGASLVPSWHSLRDAWLGEHALWRTYQSLRREDVPFGQDCIGFQFFLRDGEVFLLDGETGHVDSTGLDLAGFFEQAIEAPANVLGLEPLLQFQGEGNSLSPGYVLSEYPFFCTSESADGVSLGAVPSEERRELLADLYRSLKDVPEGEAVEIKIE